MKMNKTNSPEHNLDSVLQQTLKDDLPPAAEARMSRQFLSLKRTLDQPAGLAERDHRVMWSGMFIKEILAFVSAVMLIAGGVLHLSGNQSALAYSIERLKIIVTVSAELRHAASMDCTVRVQGAGHIQSAYRIRWGAIGTTRIDADASDGGKQTLWVPDGAVSMAPYARLSMQTTTVPTAPRDALWGPAVEFLTPAMLAENMESRYGLVRAVYQDGSAWNEVLLVGQDNQQVIEVAVDVTTFLPVTLKKYQQDSSQPGGERTCVEEVRFQWNQPIPRGLLAPKPPAGGHKPVNE
jgi:hypothetical protein